MTTFDCNLIEMRKKVCNKLANTNQNEDIESLYVF
jgi:hypothetical protein